MDIILFTGRSASGKTTLASRLAKEKGYALVGEREILHMLASQRGYARTRYWLSAEGPESLIVAAREEMIREIQLKTNLPGVILDGVYDRHLPGVLDSYFLGSKFRIVGVFIDELTRLGRMTSRLGGISADSARAELQLIDGFKTFAGVDEVMARANIRVCNDHVLDDVYGELLRELDRKTHALGMRIESR